MNPQNQDLFSSFFRAGSLVIYTLKAALACVDMGLCEDTFLWKYLWCHQGGDAAPLSDAFLIVT